MQTTPHAPASLIADAEKHLQTTVWPRLEAIRQQTFERVLTAFITHRVSESHFQSVTGYGHNDLGREVTDLVFADALEAEAALVRPHLVSGTHALATALRGALRPGDTMLSITGHPYDTLEEVIGLRGESVMSLKSQGVQYAEISCFNDPNWADTHKAAIEAAKMVYIQRSRGYSTRPSLCIPEIASLIQAAKAINPKAIVMVDNCYGEFTETHEPTHPDIGADLIAGSLIKNPGGGIVPAGGYVAGRRDLVEAAADALTCPGVGAEGGYTFDLTRLILQGLFLAPGVVHEALKGMTLSARVFDQLGYATNPHWQTPRSDIIQMLHLGTPDKLVAFCKTVQAVSPVNSYVNPVPAIVPGYEDQVVMAGGTFIEGSTIELSADGPLREPYTVFFQGGLNYAHTRYALERILENLSI